MSAPRLAPVASGIVSNRLARPSGVAETSNLSSTVGSVSATEKPPPKAGSIAGPSRRWTSSTGAPSKISVTRPDARMVPSGSEERSGSSSIRGVETPTTLQAPFGPVSPSCRTSTLIGGTESLKTRLPITTDASSPSVAEDAIRTSGSCQPSKFTASRRAVPSGVVRRGWCPSSMASCVTASASASVSGHRPSKPTGCWFEPVTAGVMVGSPPNRSADTLTTTRASTMATPAPAVRMRRPLALRSVRGAEPSMSTGISVARSCRRFRSLVSITRPPLRSPGARGAGVPGRGRPST